MSEQHPLQSLISLIEFDRTIIKNEQTITHIKKHITQLEHAYQQLKNEQNNFEQKVFNAKKVVHEQELEMKMLDAKEQEKKKLLEETDSQKAYDSLKKEITFLKKSQYDHEKKLVQSWKELESAQKTLNERLSGFKEKEDQLTQEINSQKATITTMEVELTELYKIRTEKEQGVPPEWLEKYNIMRTQTANPIVRVEYDSCSGCFAQLPPQALLDLKKKKLIQCPSCYRFLYQPNENEPS
jgi:predicted  nucleic acid-binding Zn-ribbon protein